MHWNENNGASHDTEFSYSFLFLIFSYSESNECTGVSVWIFIVVSAVHGVFSNYPSSVWNMSRFCAIICVSVVSCVSALSSSFPPVFPPPHYCVFGKVALPLRFISLHQEHPWNSSFLLRSMYVLSFIPLYHWESLVYIGLNLIQGYAKAQPHLNRLKWNTKCP